MHREQHSFPVRKKGRHPLVQTYRAAFGGFVIKSARWSARLAPASNSMSVSATRQNTSFTRFPSPRSRIFYHFNLDLGAGPRIPNAFATIPGGTAGRQFFREDPMWNHDSLKRLEGIRCDSDLRPLTRP